MAKKGKSLKAEKAAKAIQKKRKRRKKRIAILVVELLVLFLLSGAAYAMLKYNKFQKVSIDKDDLEFNEGSNKEGYTTIALFGGDSRDGQLEEGTHADCIIVASINNKTKEIKMASVYRDTLLQQMDGTYNKANASYFLGGPKEAINMLNRNLDLDIEDYATVDFKALVDTIDLLGGLEIDVTDEEAYYISEYLQETADVAGTEPHFLDNGGHYNMDGAQATTYARIRSTAGGDYKRTERQRLVIEKIFEKAVKTNVVTLNKIIDKVFEQVSTSFTLKELLSLAVDAPKYKLGETAGFPSEVTDGINYGDAGSVVVPINLAKNVEELHKFLYPDKEVNPVSQIVQQISDDIAYLTGVTDSSAESVYDGTSGTQNVTEDNGYNTDTQGNYDYSSDTQNLDQTDNYSDTVQDWSGTQDAGDTGGYGTGTPDESGQDSYGDGSGETDTTDSQTQPSQ